MDPSSIEIRPLATPEELRACVEMQRETWGDAFADIVPVAVLKVCQRIGGVAAGAFNGAGSLVGFVFGLTGVERGAVVHWSDMLAVTPAARNIGLGRKLKEYQRKTVRDLGATVIYWTYDPLIARNAHLNFNRLGVRLAEYVENMYGITDSTLHGGVPTDRLVVAWPTYDAAIAERLAEAERVLASSDCRMAPIATSEWIHGAAGASILPHCVRVAIPMNAEALLVERSAGAAAWREQVRTGIQWGVSSGYTITAFLHDEGATEGHYIMTKIAKPSSYH
ncbi:MAG TPA: hypothetical protein VHV78_03245 [Gemmatimonadaceae bacterium]|jgi:predicted GNAT superfamily acetyltransferase|nr:hypothetical protein [Gemmatimonadaceae bacterium]